MYLFSDGRARTGRPAIEMLGVVVELGNVVGAWVVVRMASGVVGLAVVVLVVERTLASVELIGRTVVVGSV